MNISIVRVVTGKEAMPAEKQTIWIKLTPLVNTPLRIMLTSVVISASFSAVMSHMLTGHFVIGLLIGIVVSSIVSYPVGKIIIANIEKIQHQKAELERLNRELEAYNRILAHDIKNKVSIISLSSQMITRRIHPDNNVYFHAVNINDSTVELAKMVNNLLTRQIDYEVANSSQLDNKSA